MVFCSFCDGVPLKFEKKRADLQFTSTDYLSIVLTPVRIRWTIPLKEFYSCQLRCTKENKPFVGNLLREARGSSCIGLADIYLCYDMYTVHSLQC
jgi:hypothetical protein